MNVPFQPYGSKTIAVTNAVAASPPAILASEADQVSLFNTSATAIAYWACQRLPDEASAGRNAVIPVAGGAPGDMPIPPGAQIRLTVGIGPKKFSLISTAADGATLVTPGHGD
jgi:hypothetical protein